MEQKFLIEDNSGDKKYFTIIPNYIANHSTANDQALYFQLKRLTDESGKNTCYPSYRYLTKQLGIGLKALRKSIKYLIDHKWIDRIGEKRVKTKGGWQYVSQYKINDIWNLNMSYYQGVAKSTLPNVDKVYPKGTQGVAKRIDRRITIDKNNYKMFYKNQPVIKNFGKLYVIQKGVPILFTGKEEDLEYKD
jgi:hypothetical protein